MLELNDRARDVIVAILGGGRGTRLSPLTDERSKPAVPIAGKYRLIDIPISNAIHSRMQRILVLTQFNSTSLHRHINLTYKFDQFSPGYVQILAAQQTPDNQTWYMGTADAIRQNLRLIAGVPGDLVLILSGDQDEGSPGGDAGRSGSSGEKRHRAGPAVHRLHGDLPVPQGNPAEVSGQ
jgi:glucose-1-phosphate adenylyltransferase